MKFTLGKHERLKSRKLIEQLYLEGDSIKVFPFKMMFLKTKHTSNFPIQAGFSVPKRNFKLAVHRNRLKRLMRETYRLQKDIIYTQVDDSYVFMISYLGKEEFKFEDLYKKMEKLLRLFLEKTQKTTQNEG